MSYHQYTTDGLILFATERGEADKRFSIFTKDLGLIFARARGVRKVESKLNSALQNLSLSSVSLIRGKNEWKITTAVSLKNLFFEFRESRKKLDVVARVCDLVSKLVVGEEKNSDLFGVIKNSIDFLQKNDFTDEEMFLFECVFVLKVLNTLGYVAKGDYDEDFFSDDWSLGVIKSAITERRKIVRGINKSLKSTHLS